MSSPLLPERLGGVVGTGPLSAGVKRPESEADHSLPKNVNL